MEHKTFHLGVLIREQAKKWANRTALRHRDDSTGTWLPITWREFAKQVVNTSCAMLANGVQPQENLAVFAQNMPQGLYTDFAAFAIRAVTIPLYATSSEAQVQYIINDAQVRILFVGQQQQYDVAFRVMSLCRSLEKIIIYDLTVKKNPQDVTSIYFHEFLEGTETDARREQILILQQQVCESDIANILYTSGTTGEPKGVMIHHACYNAQWAQHFAVLPQLFYPNQVSMSFLPQTHIFERAWTYLCLQVGIQVCINTDPHVITRSLTEVRPTMMCAVPRFWEKVYDGVQAKIAAMHPTKQKMVKEALQIGREYNLNYVMKGRRAPFGLSLKYKFYDKLVFHTLRKVIGIENGTLFPTAGAAVPPTIEDFIHSCGIPMVVGYGLTESTATVSCDYGKVSIGSIGRPLAGIQVKIGEEDEILIKGPSVTHGYYKKPHSTQQAFDEDGFFHTGDAGYMKDGELYITDRIKDLFKTSNGKYIAPQVLEGKLCVDKFIDQISIIADQRKFVSALIIPVYEELQKYADSQGIRYADMTDLVKNQEIHQMMAERIDTLQQGLAGYEQVKKFVLLAEPFSMEKGELTNTLKVRRSVLLKNYAQEISSMYES